MSITSRFSLIASIFTMLIMAPGTMVFALTVADSEVEFSDTQGQDSWFYGYYDGDSSLPFTNDPLDDDFELLTTFSNERWSLTTGWGGYWTFLWATGGHPNGAFSTSGRLAGEHWAARRWISEVSGEVNISGKLAKADPGGGNGITGHIFIDGVEVFSHHVDYNDLQGVNYSVDAIVTVGSVIDFVIDPEYNHRWDSTTFTAVIETTYPDDTEIPTGFVNASNNMIWPPNNKMVAVALEGNLLDELSIARDGGGNGISSAYLYVFPDGIYIPLKDESTDLLDENGDFSVTIEAKAVKGAVYNVELYAADTNPEAAGGPNSGFVDSTYISVPHDMGKRHRR